MTADGSKKIRSSLTKDEFTRHLEWSSAKVKRWPAWKQELLGGVADVRGQVMAEENDVRQARIRAAGVVQAVIASGAPPEEWAYRARFGLRLVNFFAAGLLKIKRKEPKYGKGK